MAVENKYTPMTSSDAIRYLYALANGIAEGRWRVQSGSVRSDTALHLSLLSQFDMVSILESRGFDPPMRGQETKTDEPA